MGGGGGENPEKTTWHTHKQNLVCVTCDCKTDQLGSNLRTYDEVFIVLVMVVAKAILLFSKSRISYQTTLLLDQPKTVSVNGMCSSF